MAEIDQETKAIGEIAGIMEALGEDQRGRVVRYILERFNIASARSAQKKSESGSGQDEAPEDVAEFDDFASLFDACNPKTDAFKALVAAYWLQVLQGAQSFDSQSANKELKNLGHPSANITASLSTLINQKPALVLQLRKSGTTKQARKLYKLTGAGIAKVKGMMSEAGETE
jgi:hypothetical protein